MRIIIACLFSVVLLYFGSNKMGSLPPIGSFFSPYHGFWKNAESTEDLPDQDIKMTGLSDQVNVLLDERLVPHIYADNLEDALSAQGYLHAQNRLWQMDMTIRSTLGTLSEVLGHRTLEYDKRQRRLGLPLASRNIYKEWEKDQAVNTYMEAYVKGINAYIDQLRPADYPLEFKLLDYKPTKVDKYSIAVIYISMANVLCSYSLDLEQSNNLSWLGGELFEDLFPDINPAQSPVIPSSHIWDFDPIFNEVLSSDSPDIGSIGGQSYNPNEPHVGSNNWAIAPKKSASGQAILCNDPHLELTLPSVWYENHISTPDLNVYGVSLPGAPGVIIGFNDDIAWGTTNGSHDVMDWFKIKWTDKSKTAYYLDDKILKTTTSIEDITVRGGSVIKDTILNTIWGPVWQKGNQDLALQWVIHNDLKLNSFKTFINLNSARNYEDYQAALLDFEAPIQNLIFADKKGDIGITVQGKMPIRNRGKGSLVLDGSSSMDKWKGFVPMDHLPKSKNPEQGYIASANQHSTDDTYPYYYHGKFDDYRGRTINKLLSQKEKITIQDCKDFQNSNYSIQAEELTKAILPYIDNKRLTDFEKEAKTLLSSWDYYFMADKRAPTLYHAIKAQIHSLMWDEFDERPESVVKPETWRTIEILNDPEVHPFIDIRSTPHQESKTDLCTQAFKSALLTYKTLDEVPPWHETKSTSISHLAQIDQFSVEVATGGNGEALNAQRKKNGPSWRMIVEMGEPIQAYGVYPGGQSGNPGSPHYADMISTWSAAEYYQLQYSADLNKIYNIKYKIKFN